MSATCNKLISDIINYTIAQSMTLPQLANVTIPQVVSALGLTGEDDIRTLTSNWKPIRNSVKNHIIKANEDAELNALKQTAQTWMNANFPDATWERSGKTITIYLEGN